MAFNNFINLTKSNLKEVMKVDYLTGYSPD
jgi:hypothetical protein